MEDSHKYDHTNVVDSTKEPVMGNEIASIGNEKKCELLRRHNIRETDPILRDLRQKLEAVHVSHSLRQQILNSEYKRLQERSNQQKERMFDNSKTLKEEIKTVQERKDEFDDMMTYNADLMKQKTDKAEQNKREQYEEKMEDKRMYEGVMNKIVKEDLESAMCKLEMKEKMRCEMVESQEQRKDLKQKQKSFDLKEEQHFRQEDLDTIDYDGIACAQRAEKFENKERSNEKIYRAVQEKEAETHRRDDLVKNLQEQEHLEQYIQDEKAQKEKVKQTNRDVQDVLIWQMQHKVDVAAEERVRDAGFVHMARQQMFDDDEKERDKELKKKEEQKKYGQELRQQILENEVRRKKNIETENQRQHVEDENDRAYYNQ